MTLHGVCHMLWEVDGHTHLCGRPADHSVWHLCVCGELLHMGTGTVPEHVRLQRSVDCPDCLARAGRPCVVRREHGSDVVMPGVHATRAALAKQKPS